MLLASRPKPPARKNWPSDEDAKPLPNIAASGEPPVSVAAVTARWVDCLQLLEVELGNGLELLRQPRPFETGRQVVQPSAVFVPQVDQRRYRRRPALGPRWGASRRRRGRRVVVPAEPGTASRLAFGWGHWYGADTTSGHVLTLRGNRDCHVCQLAQAVGQAWHQEPVSLFDRSTVSPSRPGFRGAPRAAAVKTGPTKGRATARGGLVLTAASTAPNLARLGAEVDHAACRSASFLCSARCCMFK